jgi:hypothetical protein
VEEVKMLFAAFLTLTSVALGQTSFEQYFAANKNHRHGVREVDFLQMCGVKRSDEQIIYGLSTENEGFKFHRTRGLLQGSAEARTDFFGSAEEWKVNDKPRFINVWILIMDVGFEGNEMFCLDDSGKVTLQESLNASDAEVSGSTGWIYLQRFSFDAVGKRKVIRSGYVHKNGLSAAAPKLNREDTDASKRASDTGLAANVTSELSQ